MVKVRDIIPRTPEGGINITAWLERLDYLGVKNLEKIKSICDYAVTEGKHLTHATGETCFEQGVEMAEIVSELNADEEVIMAALIYPLVTIGQLDETGIEKLAGNSINKLIQGVQQISLSSHQLESTKDKPVTDTKSQSENLKKMLLAVIEDVRVVLIKLAECVCLLSMANHLKPSVRKIIANEVMDIYAPLANRLGIGQLKWELEDLAFRVLQPTDYKTIAKLLDERREARESYIKNVLDTLTNELEKAGIDAEIYGRAKHIFSIWRKMQYKNLEYSQIYDIRAVRILVDEIKDCYATLGCVHSLWHHIPKEFDDYIATPKENGYQSLHTAVMGPEGKTLEIQIRTKKMHQEAELGVAAHWRYKEGLTKSEQASLEKKVAWLRQILDWQSELADTKDFLTELHSEAFETRVYVFTPTGEVKDLPKGATVLDFAYLIHTDIGHHTRGAKVNNKIVPLSYQLKSGETIEILTQKQGGPSRDWLNPELGYLKTARARAKVLHWFKLQDFDENLRDGKQLLDKALASHDFTPEELIKIAKKLNYKALDGLYAAVGAGTARTQQILQLLEIQTKKKKPTPPPQPIRPKSLTRATAIKSSRSNIMVGGERNLLTHIAKCCSPVPGDPVIGYATKSRGITIHKLDCSNLFDVQESAHERLIEVQWDISSNSNDLYPVQLLILAYDRQGLLSDITKLLTQQKINVIGLNTQSETNENLAKIQVTLEVDSYKSLSHIMELLSRIPNIFEIERQGE